jgi:methylated-DNA-[protein]-cysteine S-methyltransferase
LLEQKEQTMGTRATDWRYRILDIPNGSFVLASSSNGELRTGWSGGAWCDDHAGETEWLHLLPGTLTEDNELLPQLTARLQRYFRGEVVSFDDVATPKGSPFQMACWEACRAIPRGEVITYGELARRAGSTITAARAAGQSMRRNPLPIIVPCHRVVGTTGLHGFGGSNDPASENVAVKQWLLSMEGAVISSPERADSSNQAEFASFAGR